MPMFKYEKSSLYQAFAKKADTFMAWLSIPFAAFVFWYYWPGLSPWPWVALAFIPVSFLMARFDWKSELEGRIQLFFLKRAR